MVSDYRVAMLAVAMLAIVVWIVGAGPPLWILAPAALIFVAAFANARRRSAFGPVTFARLLPGLTKDTPPTDQWVAPHAEPIDIGEELIDLLKSAMDRTARMLEDQGRLDPFVLHEDADGTVRIRRVGEAGSGGVLALARETARSIDASTPRVVLAVADTVELEGRTRHVVRYEAAERRFHNRTLVFVQPIRPRQLIIPATTVGLPIYVGTSEHLLRSSKPG